MTNVSKQKLQKKTRERLLAQFVGVFASKPKTEQTKLFGALFTEAEQIMFIKRIATIFLLVEGYSTYAISKTLKISDATVRTIREEAASGRYDPIVSSMRKSSFQKEEFWKTLDVLLRCGLPPRGRGRWKQYRSLLSKR